MCIIIFTGCVEVQEQPQEKLQKVTSNENPRYILVLEVKQGHFTLNLKQHLKDAINKTEFEIEVSKEFYDNQEPGKELLKRFRGGSFITSGSIGEWIVTVNDKRID